MKRQANVLSALIQNFDTAEKAIEASANSAGSALRENEVYLDSIQGRIDLFTNSVQTMWNNALDDDTVKWFINAGTDIVKIINAAIDSIGLLNTAIVAFAGSKLLAWILKTTTGMSTFGQALKYVGMMLTSTAGTGAAFTTTIATQTKALWGASVAGNVFTKSIKTAGIALKAFFSTPLGWLTAIAAAIALTVHLIDVFTTTTEELKEELDGLKSELQGIQSDLDSVNSELETTQDRMAELLALPSLSFTEQEELDRLREQNEELERRERLLKAQEEREKKRVAEKATEVIDSQLSETSYNGNFWTGAGSILTGIGGGAGIGTGIGAALSLATGPFAAALAPAFAGIGAAIGGAIGGTATGITEFTANRISTEDKLNEEIESYEGLLSKRAELEKKLTTASDEGTGLFGWGKSEYDQTKEELEELKKEIGETETYIDQTLGELGTALDGVEYGDGADEALDKYYNALYKWEIEAGTIGAESDGLAHIFSRPEHEAAKEDIDSYVKLLKDGNENAKAEIEKIIVNNDALVADIEAMGLEIQDAIDYFTVDGSGLSSDIIANYEKGLNALAKFKDNQQLSFINDDGTTEDIGFDNLFDAEGEILSSQISKVMQGADETTRQEFEKLMKAVKDGKYNIEDELGNISINWESVTKSWNISGGLRVIAEEMERLSDINVEVFPGLEDEIKGIIDSFDELISAVGNTVTAMDELEQARAEEAYSGSVSLETLEKLMQSTDNYADLIEVDETGAIKLAANAQDILVQEKIDTIKKNAELALSSAQMRLEEAKHNQQIYEDSSPAQEVLRSALAEVGAAAAFVTSLWNDLSSGNLDGAWDRAKAAASAAKTEKKNEWSSQAAQAATSVVEAEKAVEEAEKQKKIADGLTPDNIKGRYDSSTASGGTDNPEDAEKKKVEDGWEALVNEYENKLALITNERDLIQAEIDKAEARGGQASKEMYDDLIRSQLEEKKLLEEKKTKLEEYLRTHADSIDPETWTEYNNAINETAVAIKECETNIIDFAKAIHDIDTHYFEQAVDEISRLGEEIEFVMSLFEDEEMFDEAGNWTDAGITKINLLKDLMTTYAATARMWQDRLTDLESMEIGANGLYKFDEDTKNAIAADFKSMFDSGQISKEAYDDYMTQLEDAFAAGGFSKELWTEWHNEAEDGLRDAISANKDAQDQMIEMNDARIDAIEDGINKEIEAYEEYIDVLKESLDAERDLYDFKKNVQKQSKDIASLERRIAALSGSTNAADIAERRKLEAELNEAKEGLNDTYYDHAKDQQSQALDDEAGAFTKAKETYVETMREAAKDTEQVINDMILNGIFNADVANDFLLRIQETYNIPLSPKLTDPWAAAAQEAIDFKNDVGIIAGTDIPPYVTMISDDIIKKLGTDDPNNPWNKALSMADKYADFLTSSEFSINNNDLLTFEGQINSIVSGWKSVKEAADDAYTAQTRKVTVGGNPNVGAGNGGDGGDGNPPGGNKQKTISKETRVDMIPHYLDSAGNVYYKVQGMSDAYVAASSTVNKSGILWAKNGAMYYSLSEKKLKKKAYSSNTSVKGTGKFTQKHSAYSKGTMGTSRDEWALTDEIGDELVLVPGPNGNLSFMRKGTSVVPADITANLVEWGKLNPDMLKVGGGANINMISNAVNKPEINLDIAEFLHVDHVDKDTMPELEKFVDKKMNDLVRQLNYSIKKFK